MKNLMSRSFVAAVLLFLTNCVSVNPAGTADYENPSYANEMKGFFYCGHDPFSAVFAPGSPVIWISEPANNRIWYKDVSQAVVNPLICDTLLLKFPPGVLVAPPSGNKIYVSHSSSDEVYSVNTETLVCQKVYTNTSSISTMCLSLDGSTLYLGSQGIPWHIESISTSDWSQIASVSIPWSVTRLNISPDNSLVAVGNSVRTSIYFFNAGDLSPVDTLLLPMRPGTMAFTSDSRSLVVLDASSGDPNVLKINAISGEVEYRSRSVNSYLINARIPGTNTLILPRNQDERVSILNMENMIFAPSIELETRIGAVCISQDGNYLVAVSRASTPGRATVFIKGE